MTVVEEAGCEYTGTLRSVLTTFLTLNPKFISKKFSLLNFFLKVLVPKNPAFLGKMVEVDIYESGKHFMKGQPVSDAKVYTPSISTPLAKGQVSGLTKVRDAFLLPSMSTGAGRWLQERSRFPFHVGMRP